MAQGGPPRELQPHPHVHHFMREQWTVECYCPAAPTHHAPVTPFIPPVRMHPHSRVIGSSSYHPIESTTSSSTDSPSIASSTARTGRGRHRGGSRRNERDVCEGCGGYRPTGSSHLSEFLERGSRKGRKAQLAATALCGGAKMQRGMFAVEWSVLLGVLKERIRNFKLRPAAVTFQLFSDSLSLAPPQLLSYVCLVVRSLDSESAESLPQVREICTEGSQKRTGGQNMPALWSFEAYGEIYKGCLIL
ncbi:hypothetical protein DFH09DRAFT_1076055 [Mycena vulgaris]|nr:hypothetical protein DFH09DRAFT_1076055 [Mycena vulgaris]